MSHFPVMVFRWPGVLRDAAQLQDGKYDTLIVYTEEDANKALGDGWFEAPADARAAGEAEAAIVAKAAAEAADLKRLEDARALVAASADNTAPATRAEMEAKATELGIKFDGRTSDRKLGDLIRATLED